MVMEPLLRGEQTRLENLEEDIRKEGVEDDYRQEEEDGEGTRLGTQGRRDSNGKGEEKMDVDEKMSVVDLGAERGEESMIVINQSTTAGKEEEAEDGDGCKDDGGGDNGLINVVNRINVVQHPHSQLPKPEAPPGLLDKDDEVLSRSKSLSDVSMPSIGKFFKERRNSLSASIAKRLPAFNNENKERYQNREEVLVSGENDREEKEKVGTKNDVSVFNISGLKVIVMLKKDGEEELSPKKDELNLIKNQHQKLKGQISFFSRSNCRDCTAVRSFFRQKSLKFVEINIDVYPQRGRELEARAGTLQVPQIFFNNKNLGGLVALNSLRNSGEFDKRLKEMLGTKCPADAPAPPVYGFDDEEECLFPLDEMVAVVRVLRQRIPIQDRFMKMKIVKNCFAGCDVVEAIMHHLDCSRSKAIEIAKQLAGKHFIHHVFGENDFEDGNHFYRFLEHEPFIPKCYNFRGATTNDSEPKAAVMVGQRLNKIMSAILEAYASDDRCHVDYIGINKSEEFRRYVNLAQDLQRVDLLKLTPEEKLTFFLNLYNAMVIHAVIRLGCPAGVNDRRSFYSDFLYIVGGYPFSLNAIKNGILRNNRRSPYSLVKPFGSGDRRLEIALHKVNPLIHFGLCNGTRSCPTVRFFTPEGIEAQLRSAAREFFQRSGMEVNLEKRTVYLSRIIKWYSGDFGQERDILSWIINYLDATKAGLLTHLLADGGPVNIVYQDYDWSVNS